MLLSMIVGSVIRALYRFLRLANGCSLSFLSIARLSRVYESLLVIVVREEVASQGKLRLGDGRGSVAIFFVLSWKIYKIVFDVRSIRQSDEPLGIEIRKTSTKLDDCHENFNVSGYVNLS